MTDIAAHVRLDNAKCDEISHDQPRWESSAGPLIEALASLSLIGVKGEASSWPGFSAGHVLLHGNEAVRRDRNRVDAAIDEKLGKIGMIARSLSAETYLGSRLMGLLDDSPDHPLDRLVLLVEEV